MNRLLILIRFEALRFMRDRAALGILTAALVATLLGLANGAAWMRQQQSAIDGVLARQTEALAQSRQAAARWFAAPDPKVSWWTNPADLRGYIFEAHEAYAIKPPRPLAALGIGQGDVQPSYMRVKVDSLDTALSRHEFDHPLRLALGRFDATFVVIYLWPLALLALGFTVLTEDRASSRLALLQTHGASVRTVAAAGFCVRSGAAMLALVAAVWLGTLAFGVFPAQAVGGLAMWTLIVLAYLGFWTLVCALICARTADPMSAAFRAFAAWVIIAVALPSLSSVLPQTIAPTPSGAEYIVAQRDALDRVTRGSLALIESFYDDHPELRPAKTPIPKLPWSTTRPIRITEQERAMAPVETQFEAAYERQAGVFAVASWLSPATLAAESLLRLTGNDQARHRDFVRQVRGYNRELREFFFPRLLAAAAKETDISCGACLEIYGFNDFDAVPQFKPAQ